MSSVALGDRFTQGQSSQTRPVGPSISPDSSRGSAGWVGWGEAGTSVEDGWKRLLGSLCSLFKSLAC